MGRPSTPGRLAHPSGVGDGDGDVEIAIPDASTLGVTDELGVGL
jgi:hypothetical protein